MSVVVQRYIPLHGLPQVFAFDHESIMGPVLQNLQVDEWKVKFYKDELDSKPRFATDTPRLDIRLSFTDGTWVRWHPGSRLIWSTTIQPTEAMTTRINRRRNLLKQMRPAH